LGHWLVFGAREVGQAQEGDDGGNDDSWKRMRIEMKGWAAARTEEPVLVEPARYETDGDDSSSDSPLMVTEGKETGQTGTRISSVMNIN